MKLKEFLKASHPGFLKIAHRGASADAPENTMLAFELALQAGADMIELDVLPDAGGVPMVIHDADLYRLAGIKRDIRTITPAELPDIRISLMKRRGYGAEPIPSLADILNWAKDRILLNIEIKQEGYLASGSPNIADRVLELINGLEMQSSVLISSFSAKCIDQIRGNTPYISTGILYSKKMAEGLSPIQLYHQTGADTLHISYMRARRRLIAQAQMEDIPLMVYTVNRKRTMKKLIKRGVKGIFTDKPALLKKVATGMGKLTDPQKK